MRKGFTLLELLLVMAILVILAAVSLPTMQAMYGDTRVRGAADEVRGAWAEARTRSIDNGVPYRFAIITGKEQFRLAPDTNEFWDGSSGDIDPTSESNSAKVIVGSLPKHIFFESKQDLPGGSGGWRTIAIFLPDGSCKNDASVVVRADDCDPLTISVRGITGIVTVRTQKQLEGR